MITITKLRCPCGGNIYKEEGILTCLLCGRTPRVYAQEQEKPRPNTPGSAAG